MCVPSHRAFKYKNQTCTFCCHPHCNNSHWYPHEIILAVVVKGGVVQKAGVGVWGCRLWPPYCTGNPRTGFCNQRRTAVPVGHPEHSGVSSAFQRCPGTRWTGSCPHLHDHSCPAFRLCRGSSLPGGVAHTAGAEGLRRGPGSGLRTRTGM